jgi:hypothetical protein
MNNFAFFLYLLFVSSSFLHLPSRLEFLGAIRFDLVLVVLTGALIWAGKRRQAEEETLLPVVGAGDERAGHGEEDDALSPGAGNPLDDGKRSLDKTGIALASLIVAFVVAIPFVEWPGSAIFHGIPNLIKAVVFYYFTVSLVTTERKLKIFIAVFVAAQSFRVVEPVYLHLTDGYWGDQASMAWEFLDRLSGAPHDVINPNGLAFVIVSVLPFVYYLSPSSLGWGAPLLLLSPVLLYALALTGSRSGFIALIMMLAAIVVKGRRKALLAACFAALVAGAFVNLTPDQQDRYVSVFDSNTKNAATVEGRWTGVRRSFEVALRRPVFGHGLGTSREANGHFGDTDKPAHNLYAEIAQEGGIVGLAIFVFFMKTIFDNLIVARRKLRDLHIGKTHLARLVDAMQVWIVVTLVFSIASYGLSSYEWYLAGGLSVVMLKLVHTASPAEISLDENT